MNLMSSNLNLSPDAILSGAGGGGQGAGAGGGGSNPTGDQAPAWLAQAPEDVRNEPCLKQHKEIGSLIKSYVHAQRMIGADKILAPQQNWTEAQWGEFFDKVGRPKTAAEYQLPQDVKLNEGLTVDEAKLAKVRDLFHKSGLTSRQAQDVLRFYFGTLNEAQASEKAAFEQSQLEGMNKLKEKFGDKLASRIDLAQFALKSLVPQDSDFFKFLADTKLGNHPQMVEVFSRIGEMLSEDKSRGTGANLFVKDSTAAIQEIAKLTMDKDFWTALNTRSHPGHDAALQRWEQLHQVAYPGKQE